MPGDGGNDFVAQLSAMATDFTETLRKEPLKGLARGTLAYMTAGASEVANAVIDKNVREPKRTAEGLAIKASMERQAGIDEERRFLEAEKKNRAAQSTIAQAQSRTAARSTILTSPLGQSGRGRTILGG